MGRALELRDVSLRSEQGKVVLDGTTEALREDDDVKERGL
ncbi:hypothetical protein N177_3061 [Lutibaculum baratangense AMV1]|uniref:Uncharacterized protein n=1 Tax=Lutibaculum baratangense AMV1 TaxID=631454 RepID=V4T8W9_9HYPH|nr:hypothetical protein N177_3061 [Lutibaculum baratangense AMV1]